MADDRAEDTDDAGGEHDAPHPDPEREAEILRTMRALGVGRVTAAEMVAIGRGESDGDVVVTGGPGED